VSRRASGEGSIKKADDGSWRGAIRLGTDPTGKAIRRYVRGRTQTEVRTKLDRLRKDQAARVDMTAGGVPTVAAWLTTWLDLIERTCKPSTAKTYRTHVRYAIEAFGHVRIDKLTTEQVEALYVLLTSRGLKPVSVAGVHRTLRSAFNRAVRRRRLAHNPVADARPDRVQEQEVVPLTVAEAQAILAAATGRRNPARWEVALTVGLRQGEALGLQWDDVDLDAGTLDVRRALQQGKWRHGCPDPERCGQPPRRCPKRYGGGLIVVEPKSATSKRTVSLADETVSALRSHRAVQAAERLAAGELWQPPPSGELHSGSGWVFATAVGGAINPRRDWADWKALLADADVRDARLHDARHSCATFMLVVDVDPRTVMGQLGWSHPSLLTRYQHVVPELQKEAARRVGDLLFHPAKGG
jgi:integrase